MTSQDLLTRAVADVVPRALAEEKLTSGKPMRVYLGIDPTGARLHLGHSVPLRKLKAFCDAGHHVIFLIGGFTAMIGDPTGQDKMREPLTEEEVEKNFATYKEQAGKILDFAKIEIRNNREWLEPLTPPDFLRISSHFTVQQMLQRDMFKDRMSWKAMCVYCKHQFNSPIQFPSEDEFAEAFLEGNSARCPNCKKKTPILKENITPPENPPNATEMMYPLMQAYDSVMLDVDCEIGGNDQLFNMLCGRKLQKRYKKREKFVLTTKLIEGTDGRKMSKTYDNCIWLEDSAKDMYAKLLMVKDELILSYFECVTEMPIAEIKEIEKSLKAKSNPKDAKMRLAREVVTLYHGAAAAKHEEEQFTKVFSHHGMPEDIKEVKAEKGSGLVDLMVKEKLVSSKNEAKRLIGQGGVHVNDKKVTSIEAKVKGGVLKVGKRKFIKILL